LAIVSLITSKQIINIIALIIPVFSLISVSIGVGFIVSALYVFFRDLPYFYELVCFLLWISSPIFYPSEIVPDSVKIFLFLNPLSPIIESIRQISLSGNSPDLLLMLHSCISSLVIVTIGIVFFKTGRRYFMDLL
jgi:ABC-type polysaccharide/polyol phosphate export permease